MSKKARLKKASEFRRVFKEGKRIFSRHFALYIRENNSPATRIGVSIAKRHFKLATRRNKIRRVAKEAINRETAACRKGCDYVITSRANHPGKDIKKALEEIRSLVSQPGHK